MQIHEINETTRNYIIRLTDEMNDFEDIIVEMATAHIKPESPFFTHCEIKFKHRCNRTIDNHIKYFETICEGLRKLKEKLEDPA